jgi:hypothetical protein
MTNRDPYDSRDPYANRRLAGWSPGAIVAAIIAATLIVGVFAYAMNTPSFHTGGAPGASTSAPGTTGQGGRAPPSGNAR